MAATKSAKKTTKKSIAQEIIASMKWRGMTDDMSVDINGYSHNCEALEKYRRVDIVNPARVDVIDLYEDGITVLNNKPDPIVVAALVDPGPFPSGCITEAILNQKNSIEIDEDSEGDHPNCWWGILPSTIGYDEVELFPNGEMAVGCQRHTLDHWEQNGHVIINNFNSGFNTDRDVRRRVTLDEFIPLARKFIASHKPGKIVTVESIRQMLLDKIAAPIPVKKRKTAAKKTTKKKKVARKR